MDALGDLSLEPDAAHLFFPLVSRRYERGAILITLNRSVSEWGMVFADSVVATMILDRLLHHSHVITMRGDSYRFKAKRRSGLLRRRLLLAQRRPKRAPLWPCLAAQPRSLSGMWILAGDTVRSIDRARERAWRSRPAQPRRIR
jgi:hypothetical protein